MSRRLEKTVTATRGALVEGEETVTYGLCWGAQLGRVPALFLARRRYVMILTNRRLLLFGCRGRRIPGPTDLVIGKRYEWFKLGRVRRLRPLMQVLVTSGNGTRMLFEFQPRRRTLGRAFVKELNSRRTVPALPAGLPTVQLADRMSADESAFWGPSTKPS